MADITITGADGNPRDCASGDLWPPYIGNWTSYLTLVDADSPPTGPVTLLFHGLTLQGFVLRAGTAEDLNTVAIMGGAGGLCNPIPPQMFDNQHSVGQVVQYILGTAGEVLSGTSTTAVLNQTLPQYPVLADEPGRLLDTLCDALNATGTSGGPVVWRVLPDGTVFFGQDTWTDLTQTYLDTTQGSQPPQYQLLHTEPTINMQTIAPVSIAVLPGTAFLLGNVGSVRYQDDGKDFIGRIYYLDSSGQPDDPLTSGLRGIVQEQLRPTTFHQVYTGRVVLQRDSGRLDIAMDDVRLPGLTNIPYRVPVPGASLTVPAGSRVRVEFEGGDPRRASAGVYEPGTGGKPVGRVGDLTGSGTLSSTVATAGPVTTITLLWTPQGGGTPVPILTVAGAAISGTAASVPITGQITSGSPNLSLPS